MKLRRTQKRSCGALPSLPVEPEERVEVLIETLRI
jgi:hypothetical protein